LPSQALLVRSASIDVLSLNLPPVPGADEPLATTTERLNSLPSLIVPPPEFSYVPTQTSPNPFGVPAGSSLDSAPANSRPCLSHARTGSPALAVRMRARLAYGEVSPG
jgi:hypothetical protein